jgi:hypothetical protein
MSGQLCPWVSEIHPQYQRRMTATLRHLIGSICHIYIDDIIIWSNSVEEHTKHIHQVLSALQNASLYCNPKKCEFYQLEVNFLGHRISQRGIEAQSSKVDKILQWPIPTSAMEVHSFLGLVRYISTYLPKLAEYTAVLTPLTTNEAKSSFPPWSTLHQSAFDAIKSLVVSRECLLLFARIWPHVTNTTNCRFWVPNSKQRYLDNQRSNRQTAMLYFISSLMRRAPPYFYTVDFPVRDFQFFPSLTANGRSDHQYLDNQQSNRQTAMLYFISSLVRRAS